MFAPMSFTRRKQENNSRIDAGGLPPGCESRSDSEGRAGSSPLKWQRVVKEVETRLPALRLAKPRCPRPAAFGIRDEISIHFLSERFSDPLKGESLIAVSSNAKSGQSLESRSTKLS